MATEMVKGKGVSKCFQITQDDILNGLGGLPEESTHCALLAANTLREAIRDYIALKMSRGKEPTAAYDHYRKVAI